MNFHWELRKGSIRWKLRTWAGQRVRVVEVQRHELRVERLPERGRCRIRYSSRRWPHVHQRPGGAVYRLGEYAGGCTL